MNQNKFTKDNSRGQVGIGTLIVFIAMVLVAAIAAGVLINTAGFLQTQAEDTGTESTEQVADNLNVITETGNVSGDDNINQVRIGVQPASGASDINLARLTLQYVSDDSFANIVIGNDTTTGEDTAEGDSNPDNIVAASGNIGAGEGNAADRTSGDERYFVEVITAEQPGDIVMTDGADRYEVVIPLTDEGASDDAYTDTLGDAFNGDLQALSEGSEVEITITTEAGAQVVAFMQVPDSLAGESAGSNINL